MAQGLVTSIPHEIQNLIVDEVYYDATTSPDEKNEVLSKCCLVSSWWLARARHWLFSDFKFDIYTEDDPPKTSEFIQFLQSPHSKLSSCVFHLRICGPDISIAGCIRYGSVEEYDVLNTYVETALPFVHTVRTVEFYCFAWDRLTSRVKEGLQHLPQISSLRWDHVDFDAMKLPDFLFLSSQISPNLEVLHIKGETYMQSTTANFLPPSFKLFPRLHTLDITAWRITAPLLESDALATLPTLKNLCIEARSTVDLHFLRCIEAIGPRLQHLTLPLFYHWEIYDDPALFPLSLHENSNLSSLKLDMPITFPGHVQWVSRLIATSTSTSLDVFVTCGYTTDFDVSPLEKSLLGDVTKIRRLHLERFADETTSWFDDKERLLPELFRRGQLFW